MTASPPTLSVVIPTRNRAQLLRRAIESALGADADVIVIDDASDDDTHEVVRSFKHQGVVYRKLTAKRGPCVARNLGVRLARGELVLFLDDDDVLLRDGDRTIRQMAESHPGHQLYLHNSLYADGSVSITMASGPAPVTYRAWLLGHWDHELKPVVRRGLFDVYEYDDTGAGGEGLLWGRVIRDHGAIAGEVPVVAYNTASTNRLTSAVGLLEHARENARIGAMWLDYFGEDLASLNSERWADRAVATSIYRLLSGDREGFRAMLNGIPPELVSPWMRAALGLAPVAPLPLLRLLFIAHRRELRKTASDRRLLDAVLPS